MPEHSTIQSADCHEPKFITTTTTADTGKVITPSSSTSATSELRKLKATELDSTGGSDGQVLGIVSSAPAWIAPGASEYSGLKVTDGTGSIASIGTTPKKFDAFDTVMPENGATGSASTDDITISTAGDYMVSFSLSAATTAAGDAGDYTFHVRKNGAEAGIACEREFSGTTDTGGVAMSGILTLAASDVLTVYVESDEAGGTDDLDIFHAQFTAVLLKAS